MRLVTKAVLAFLLMIGLIVYLGSGWFADNPESGYGNTYYVAKNGSDSNPGTEAQPWLTIRKAALTMTAGDTVYIKEGVYHESIEPANSGDSGAWITYRNYPGDRVVLDGTGFDANAVNIVDKSCIRLIGFRITNWSSQSNRGLGIFVSGPCSHFIFQNLTIDHLWNAAILMVANWSYDTYISDVLIDGNLIHDVCQGGVAYAEEAISLVHVKEFEVKNNILYNIKEKEGIAPKVAPANGSIHDNVVYNGDSVAIYLDGENIEIYNNIIFNWGYGLAVGPESEMSHLVTRILDINNNIIYQNFYSGISFWFFRSRKEGVKIINNTLYHNGTDGEIAIFEEGSYFKDCIIRNNIIDGNSIPLIRFPDYASADIAIDHNLFSAGFFDQGSIFGKDYIRSDPLFVDPAAGNFQLKISSPAIDAGAVSNAPAGDYSGVSRPQGKGYDIGAFEY